MEEVVVASPQPLIDTDPAPPAPGADEQKPNPASEAEGQNSETPDQQQAKRESRRARARARDAAALATAQTEARMLREQLERANRGQSAESGEPKRDNFPDYESYLEARTDWRADQKVQAGLKAVREESQRREQQGKAGVSEERAAQEWSKREKAFQATTADYDEVAGSYCDEDLGRLSEGTRRAIIESEVGPQVLYHLASHPEVHERIAGLSPLRQIAELGKLEDKLSAPPVKEGSKAPPPVKPVAQGKSAVNDYSENMSDAEYRNWRKSQGARWAR